MSFLQELELRASSANKTIILPEGQDPRVLNAALDISRRKIAKVIVLASEDELQANPGIDLKCQEVEVIDHKSSLLKDSLAAKFQEIRAHKGVTPAQALTKMDDRLYFGNMMVRTGHADGLVAGSISSTGNMLRAAFHCIGTTEGIKTGSSCFAMELKNPSPAGASVLFYADCAVNPTPTPEQLADIALSTARTYRALVDKEPRIAFLSFSTNGSAKHELIDKTREAVEITRGEIKSRQLDIVVDGELQVDAALVPEVAASKCSGSPIAGRANILIFPDLQSANISYKLTQRLAGAGAYGPILQGLAKPVNDLSRGCVPADITAVAIITACQAAG